KYWRAWSRGFLDMLVDNQRTAPACYAGSWDPSGPWGTAGGRVYSTALLTLCLEVTYRYEQVFEEEPR
ncbi:MAG: prenyltransferase/squalene oxidase repeat-containing protein, partial [Planctomycetota bacterium]